MSYERLREREVHRYYQTWLEASAATDLLDEEAVNKPALADGSKLSLSTDTALIAFAQLACLRLAAKRGVVTLITTNSQYILAEATKTSSLNLVAGDQDEGDELWFGYASLPRSQGISQDALMPGDYTATSSSGDTYTAPALVINDITFDDRYSHSAYAGKGVTFYCGVPIVTKAGHHIGVYTVTDDKPRNGLTPAELRFMVRMADVVADHLENVRSNVARSRGEKLVLGLGRFVDGETASHHVSKQHLSGPSRAPEIPKIEPANDAREFLGMTITNADISFFQEPRLQKNYPDGASFRKPENVAEGRLATARARVKRSSVTSLPIRERPKQVPDPHPDDLNSENPHKNVGSSKSEEVRKVFSRAAQILHTCSAADGVAFYNAVSANSADQFTKSNHQIHSVKTSISDGSEKVSVSLQDPSEEQQCQESPIENTTASERSQHHLDSASSSKHCEVLSHSLSPSTVKFWDTNMSDGNGLTEQDLRRLIRRYPHGKLFSFTAEGEYSASESDSTALAASSYHWTDSKTKTKSAKMPTTTSALASEVIKAVPGARNVIWLPLWDISKQRWFAGTLLWSRSSERLIAARDDLLYLRIFGKNIMNEVSRLDTLIADKAKASFIANISHELRSPLHGILGSVEFLHETSLDSFQSSMVTAVETCGKTLLDTVEHVLDYAKINKITKKKSRHPVSSEAQSNLDESDENEVYNFALEEEFDIAVMFEEVIEAVFAGQTFRPTRPNHLQESPLSTDQDAEKEPQDKSTEQIRTDVQRGSGKFSGAIRLVLDIECLPNWWVRTQPGAVRRILMNLFGNSLKYTEKGTIKIALSMDQESAKLDNNTTICIIIADTGRGMSADFLRNHAFTPFTQESEFSAGTGLGLSIVRHLVSSLGGKIEVQSEKGKGTEFKVWFDVARVETPTDEGRGDKLLHSVMQRTPGLSICMLDPSHSDHESDDDLTPINSLETSLRNTMDTWFGMKTMRAKCMDGVKSNFFVYAEPPPIEYLMEHHGDHAKGDQEVPLIIIATNAFESASLAANDISQLTDIGRILEVVPQPCGPQKLAKAFHRCLERLDILQKGEDNAPSDQPAVERVVEGTKAIARSEKKEDEQPTKPESGKNQEPKEPTNSSEVQQDENQDESAKSQDIQGGKAKDHNSTDKQPATARRSSSGPGANAPEEKDNASTILLDGDRVLLVDDNQINLNLLMAFMKRAKKPFEAVKDGKQAVEAFEKASANPATAFRHVLMDISMPIMDGITATREIRKLEKSTQTARSVTILALTGQAAEDTREEMFQAGADYFLTKPVKFKELIGLLNQ